MKALQLVAPSRLAVVELPCPVPAAGEVRLRVKACGICGSDLHGMDGRSGRRIPPLVMGHEASGVIEAVGEGVEGWSAGDRVTFDSTVWCGECGYCREGRVNLCDRRQVVGVACEEFRRDGAFAEFLVVPARILHRLGDGLSFVEGAFAEPVGVAMHAVRRGGDLKGKEVVVVGSGLIGLLVIQSLARAGVERVIAVDRDGGRLRLARELGAAEAYFPEEWPEGREVEAAFEVVGAAETMRLAMGWLKKGGRLVLVGNLAPETPFLLQRAVTRELEVVGSCAIAGEYPEALEAMRRGEIRVKPLVSGWFALKDGVEGFERAQQRGALKVMMTEGGEWQ